MSYFHIALIFGSSIFAGLANALAGGGTFFSFPALTAGGLSAHRSISALSPTR
jgi:uncharacterized membrane protein YfcA